MELAAGMLVTENVRLIAPLGEGGMGSVWAAEHLGLRTRVAVKFIAQELLDDDPDMVKRFRREAGAAARIKSPHVVQTLDHGVMGDGTPYIVMELLEGESLAQRLDRVGTLPLDQIAEITAQVARGLGKAHAAGIVHRDVKPDNVFLVGSDEDELFIKLLDFGVAKHTGVQSYSVVTGTGAMIGTPGYMSPEQVLTGKHVDHRSDLWSLAVVVYHAMIGDIPFQGETFGALCVSITRGEHVPPSRVRSDVPHTVDAWMARALALDPEQRFQSAKELAVTLRGAVRGVAPWADAAIAELSAVDTAEATEDVLPTVQRPSPLYRGSHGTIAQSTVLMPTPEVVASPMVTPPVGTPTLPTMPLPVGAPVVTRLVDTDEEVETRRRGRAARASRMRWLVAGVVAALGFFCGFLIVLVARPNRSTKTIAPPPAPTMVTPSTSVAEPPEPPTEVEDEVPPPLPGNSSAAPRPRPTPDTRASAPPITPPITAPAPNPQEKDRGF